MERSHRYYRYVHEQGKGAGSGTVIDMNGEP